MSLRTLVSSVERSPSCCCGKVVLAMLPEANRSFWLRKVSTLASASLTLVRMSPICAERYVAASAFESRLVSRCKAM